ncbi:MAG: VTC domain-containing protein, partial [Lachnospiraceae bacterium]|nr:VTC domain-containing protein [Lachnospiraceae bacterium]
MTESYAKATYRHEYKYVCNAMENAILKTRAQGILKRDEHAGPDGAYTIRSLYFDDLEDRCYYENESGIGERDKYRIRIYNGDISRITLEKKSKERGMTLK